MPTPANEADKKRAKARDSYLLRTYGITTKQYDAMLKRQASNCAICRKPAKAGGRRLSVDHDHKTGKVRGLLCHLCNRGLSYWHDDKDVLVNASLYLAHPPASDVVGLVTVPATRPKRRRKKRRKK